MEHDKYALSGGINVVDKQGKKVGNLAYGTNTAQAALLGRTLYSDGNKNFTDKLPAIYADFNDGGDIVIHAPKEVLEMESFKTNVLDDATIKQLSAAYKTDPSTTFPDPKDDTKTITIAEQLEKLNEGLEKYRRSVQGLLDVRNRMNPIYQGLSLDNVLTANTIAKGNSDRQVIPDVVLSQSNFAKIFEKMPSWDPETKSASKADILKAFWTFDDSSRDELLSKWSFIKVMATHPLRDQYGEIADGDQAAKVLAFKTLLEENDATATSLEGSLTKVAEALAEGTYSFAAQFSAGMLSFFSLPGAIAQQTIGDNVLTDITRWSATSAAELERSVDFLNDETELVDKTAAGFGDLMQILGNLGAILLTEKISSDALSFALKPIKNAADAMLYLSDNLEKVQAGSSFVLKTLPISIVKNIVAVSANLMRSGMKLAEFFGEVIVDAAVDTPAVMESIMSGDDVSQDVKDSLMEEASFNGLGVAMGMAAGKALRNLSTTRIGKRINSFFSVLNAKIQTKVGDALATIKLGRAGADAAATYAAKAEEAAAAGKEVLASKYRKLQATAAARQELRETRRVLAGLSPKDVNAVEAQVKKIRLAEAAYDVVSQGGKQTYDAILAGNTVLRESNEAASKALADALKQQRAAGLVAKAGKYGSSGLSEVGSQYVSLAYRIELATRAAADATSTLHAAAKEALPVYQEQMAALVQKMTPEYKAALDAYQAKVKLFYNNMTDFAISEGLLSEKVIAGYRETGLFADGNYMRVVVESDVQKIRMMRADGLVSTDNILDIKHLNFPAAEQTFVDPEVVRYWYGLEVAQALNAKTLAESMISATGATTTILASDKEIRAARDISLKKKPVVDEIAKNVGNYIDQVNASVSLAQIADLSTKTASQVKAGFAVRRAKANIAGLYRQSAVGALSDDALASILKGKGYESGSVLESLILRFDGDEAAFKAWYKEAPSELKSWLRARRTASITSVEFNNLDDFVANTKGLNQKNPLTFEQFNEMLSQPDFKRAFDNKFVLTDKSFADNAEIDLIAKKVKESGEYVDGLAEAQDSLKKASEELSKSKEAVAEATASLKEGMDTALDSYIERIMANKTISKNVYAIADYSGADPKTVAQYIILDELRKKKNLELLHNAVAQNIAGRLKSKDSIGKVKALSEGFNKTIDNHIGSAFNDVRTALDDVGATIIDRKKWADEIKTLQKKIAGASSEGTAIKMSDGFGGIQLTQVSPNLAFLYNYRPRREVSMDIFSRFNRLTSKLFRFGTTTVSGKSFVNQLLKDSGNAYFGGNAWRSINQSADQLVDVFGERIVQELKAFQPKEYEAIASSLSKQGAEATTENVAREAVKNVQAMGAALSPASTETELFRRAGKASDTAFEKMQTGARGIADKLDNVFNGKREQYLRNRVFMNALNDAMAQGHSFKEAQGIATNMMQNATTNFSRSLLMLDSIAENVPYIRSAVNGTTSFWRMWSLDPVGVTGRIMGGLFMPYTYLLGQSLADPDNIEIYRSIPEYEKDSALVFVLRGQKFSIPIPQEVAGFIAPFRQLVEYMYDANKNNFWELLGNDILGLSPVDLTGFSAVDLNTMTSDPTIMDRLGRGVTRLISQLSPVPIKAAWIASTGIDPYTGKRIANTSYTYYDDETGEEVPMGYSQGRFAEWTAKILNNDNPALVSAVVSSVIGVTGEDVMDTLTGFCQMVAGDEGADSNIINVVGSNLVGPQLEGAIGTIKGNDYDMTDSLWRQAVRELEVRKDSITESKKWKDLQSALSQATDQSAIAKLRAQRQDMIDEYVDDVINTVKRLQSEYGGTFDRVKYASVLQLLNFSTNVDFDISNQHLRDLSSDAFYSGRNEAIRTMREMGVSGTSDFSIFGYLKQGKDGVSIKYNQPTAILDMDNAVYGAQEIELANIKSILEKNELTSSTRYTEYQKLKTSADKKAFKAEWNAKVVEALAPYIQTIGVDEVIGHTSVSDYLDNIIYVSNPYKAKDYIKKIFKGE